jgi:hypothetical protein
MVLAVAMLALASQAMAVTQPIVVDISKATFPTQMAVQVCVGLFNRDDTVAGTAYSFFKTNDKEWLADTEGITNPYITPTADFLKKCMQTEGLAKGYIRYNATEMMITVPNLVTLAAVLDAVPLEDADPAIAAAGAPLVFDAVKEWEGFGYYDATNYMYTNYVNLTSTMSKMNPGLNVHTDPIFPKLTGKSDLGLVDFIVAKRLFNFFLNDGCIPLTRDHTLMDKMVATNPWPQPVRVYGYDDTFPLAGDLYEAETNCVKRHNLGQIASNGCSNLAFYSRKPPISTPILQNNDPPVPKAYNGSKTYVVLVMGDGDNLNFVKGSRREWMQKRVAYCTNTTSTRKNKCFPVLWSMSPVTLHAAPDWLRWYYQQAAKTKVPPLHSYPLPLHSSTLSLLPSSPPYPPPPFSPPFLLPPLFQADYFVLPPSGDLYAYPSLMEPAQQAEFVRNTEKDCYLMNTSGTVAWDFIGR